LDWLLQPPTPTPSAGYENTWLGLRITSLTFADSAGAIHNSIAKKSHDFTLLHGRIALRKVILKNA
jgi:hypothetical protein